MAISYKDTEKKIKNPVRSIKVTNVGIDGDLFVDEEGSIAQRLLEVLPQGIDVFDLKMSFELPDPDEAIDFPDFMPEPEE